MLALNPAFAGAGVGSFTTWLYSGTDTGSVFQQYCYTNGALCVITDRADRVAEPAQLVQRRPETTNTYSLVRRPQGQDLVKWIVDVKTDATIGALPSALLEDIGMPAATYTGETVTLVGAGVGEFSHWDKYLLLIPCFEWVAYDLVYDLNDGSRDTHRDFPSEHLAPDAVTLAPCTRTRTGYDFTGWSRGPDGPAEFAVGETVTGIDLGVVTNGPFSLYAVWQKRNMVLDLDPCGGTVSPASVTARIDEPLSLPTPVREHYDFLGWYTQSAGGRLVEDGAPVTRDDLETLFAQWRLQSHVVCAGTATPRYGSVWPNGDQTLDYGSRVTLDAVPQAGYVFVGWDDGVMTASRTVTVASNAVYWARFAPATYAVDFVYRTAAGDIATNRQTVASGGSARPPANDLCQNWTGHPFLRWNGTYRNVTADTVVTAEYGSTASRIYFHPNGGTGSMSAQDFAPGEASALRKNAFVRDGATFLGWADAPTAATNEVAFADGAVVSAPAPGGFRTLYAVWSVPPPPLPDPESVTLPSDVWQALSYPKERAQTGETLDPLTATVVGPGTLAFAWTAEGEGLSPEATACTLATNGVTVAELVTEDGIWLTNAVTVVTDDRAAETTFVWQRTGAEAPGVRLAEVTWTPAPEEPEDPGYAEPVPLALASEGWTNEEGTSAWTENFILKPLTTLTAQVAGWGRLTFDWASPVIAGLGGKTCTFAVAGQEVRSLMPGHETVVIPIDGTEGTTLAWKRVSDASPVTVSNVQWEAKLPPPEPEPVEPQPVTLSTDGWLALESDAVRCEEGEAKDVLPGEVEGPGTLTFRWMADADEAADASGVCAFLTNGVEAVDRLQADGAWRSVTVTVDASSNEAKTSLAWQRLGEVCPRVSVADVVWQSVPPPDPIPVCALYHVEEDLTYDGREKTGVVAIAGCTLSAQRATAAGDYKAVATLNEGAVWWDGGTEATRTVDWTIARGVYDMSGVLFDSATVVADGTPKSLAVTGALPAGVTVSYEGNGETACGSYSVIASFAGDADNYEAIQSLEATLSIVSPFGETGACEPGTSELEPGALSFFDVVAKYDGQPHGPDAEALAAAFAAYARPPLTVDYASERTAAAEAWQAEPIGLRDVGTTTVWYRVATESFGDFVHAVRVTVTPRDLASVTVEPIPDQTWAGEPLRPVPVVRDGEPSLVTEKDYAISYADNAGVGLATVILTGCGNYVGTKSATFVIAPAKEEPGDDDDDNDDDDDGDFVDARQLEPFAVPLTDLGVPAPGPKATVKAEGLPNGLKLAKVSGVWMVSGTPKETLDGVTRCAYVRVTENKVPSLYVLGLRVLPADAAWTDSVGVPVERELDGVTAASGLPSGVRFKAGVCAGTPTKPGVFTVTLTKTDKTKEKAFWTIEPAVTPTCAVGIDTSLPQEAARTVVRQGVAYAWPIEATAGASVTASGLPAGLKLAKTPVKENGKVVRYEYALTGAPTKDGEFVTTFKTKLGAVTTVTTEAFSVRPLPVWAVGTFNGGGADGQVTLTVSKVGKLSGKAQADGLTWTLAAAAFAAYDAERDAYDADLVAKSGKLVRTVAVTFTADEVGGLAVADAFEVRQNNWKTEPWKTLAKAFAAAEAVAYAPFGRPDDTVSLKVATSGTVTLKGSFVIGENPRTGAPVRYAVSRSAVLCPVGQPDAAGAFPADVLVSFPPKKDKLPDGYVACVRLHWTGSRFLFLEADEGKP